MSNQNNNPANSKLEIPSDFQPMTSSVLRLEVPKKDGYHRHWFRGNPERIARAQKAGYRFVDSTEVNINNFDLGGDAKVSGSTDLGTRVSVISGDDVDATGQPGKLYLMECPEHLYQLGKKILDERVDDIATALRGGKIGAGAAETGETRADSEKRYVKGNTPELFIPNKTRRP
jgi:hypothetical protein